MKYIACDTETGGLYPATDALLLIAAVSHDGRPFHLYVDPDSQPGKCVRPEAAEVNGYTPEKWQRMGAVKIRQAMGWFKKWLETEQSRQPWQGIVCHNVTHDRGFLLEAERMTGIELPGRYDWRCSMSEFQRQMDRGLISRGSGSLDRLGELSGFWKKEGGRAAKHDALQDARASLHGWDWLEQNIAASAERWAPVDAALEREGKSADVSGHYRPSVICECGNWAWAPEQGPISLDGHHPRCQYWIENAPDPRHSTFGRLVWAWIEELGGDYCWREDSEDILPLAEKAGLVRRVIYDPALHGEEIEADPGSEIWFWGKEGQC